MRAIKRRYLFPDGSNYPIIESDRAGMVLLVKQDDVAQAERHDPMNCALARCAERIGAEKAFIAGTVAYVVLPYEGELVAMKYGVPPKTRRAIHAFDETGEMPAEGFVLGALGKSNSAASKKVRNANRPASQKQWRGQTGGNREDLRTYRHLTGHVRTKEDE